MSFSDSSSPRPRARRPGVPPILRQPEAFIESSRCRGGAQAGWSRWLMQATVMASGVMVLLCLLESAAAEPAERASFAAVAVFWLACGLTVLLAMRASTRARRREQRFVDTVAEMIRRRHWSDAGRLLEVVLARPMRTPSARLWALALLAGLLSRVDHVEQAVAVYDSLLDEPGIDDLTAIGLELGRTMAMLREERLFDADRAINNLRRDIGRQRAAAASADGAAAGEVPADIAEAAAMLGLVEMYRDVKTGHGSDALAVYEARLPEMTERLGHRVADAHALAARALDVLGRADEAATAYERATLLAPAAELHRRYVELDAMSGRFLPVMPPTSLPTGDSSGQLAASDGRALVTLPQRLEALSQQLEEALRSEAWSSALSALPERVELAELMPAAESARAQATMALAAAKLGLPDWRDWLQRRAALLADPAWLCAATPALSPLWQPRV